MNFVFDVSSAYFAHSVFPWNIVMPSNFYFQIVIATPKFPYFSSMEANNILKRRLLPKFCYYFIIERESFDS